MKKLTKKEKSEIVYNKLDSMFHGRTCELNFSNTFELLIAVILSAQCTDKRVNLVTEQLFKKYSANCRCEKNKPFCECGGALLEVVNKKPIIATDKEISENPPSRSAKLRVARKIKD